MILPILLSLAGATQAHPVPKALTDAATWFSTDDYPPSAVRAGEEGAVKFQLDVTATGAVSGCQIVESSGFADLDGQTCASAMIHARFEPAVDAHGKPVASTYTRRTIWVLPRDDAGGADGGNPLGWVGMGMNMTNASADVAIDATGRVTGCKLVRAYATTVNPCRAFVTGQTVVPPTIKDGNATPATLHVVTLISVDPSK